MITSPRASSTVVLGLASGLVLCAATASGPPASGHEMVCHVPSGNPSGAVTLEVSPNAAREHLANHDGDYRGACGSIPGDKDADGVIDALDNCLDRHNTDQRDTDHDGVGNACDADFDQSGTVDGADAELLLAELSRRRALTHEEAIRSRDFDLDGDGLVDGRDQEIFRQLFGHPPGPRLDTDGDGAADLDDPCLATRSGARAIVPGCSALDLVQNPGALVDPVLLEIDALLAPLRPQPAMREVVRGLEVSAEQLKAGARRARAADPCGGAERFAAGEASLGQAFEAMTEVRRRAEADLAFLTAAGDVTEDEMEALGREVTQARIGGARDGAVRAADAMGRVCAAVRPLDPDGLVTGTFDADRRIELITERGEPGRLIGLAEPVTITGALSEGASAVVRGVDFGDGTGLATGVASEASDHGIGLSPCLALRFAPVQPMPPNASGPFLLHDPRGYLIYFGLYMVESGVRVAVKRTCALLPDDIEPFVRYSVEVTIDYTDTDGAPHVEASVAADLVPGETPVLLPYDLDPDSLATLHVRHFKQTCPQRALCGPKTETGAEDFPLWVRERGSLCTVSYTGTRFAVDDQVANDKGFAAATAADPWPLDHFEAEGYALCGNQISCAPNVSTISGGQVFALHNYDFYPIHRPFGIQTITAALATGVDHAAGLKWPRVRGLNLLGHEFQYSCKLPEVVRDVVNFCSRLETHDHTCIAWDSSGKCTATSSHTTNVNAFYRLPFLEGVTSWVQGQGNKTPCGQGCATPSTCPSSTCNRPTHFGGYAYDMKTPCDNDIRAARAGRVIPAGVIESNDKQLDSGCAQCLLNAGATCCPSQNHQCCPSSSCSANALYIRHQDGTIGQYVHFPKDGIVPQPGDVVKRGELVGWVGVTGRTSGPHLHFAERSVWDQCCTHLMLFEAIDPVELDKLQCYEPKSGDALRSNSQWP